jgi:hypothetical protein
MREKTIENRNELRPRPAWGEVGQNVVPSVELSLDLLWLLLAVAILVLLRQGGDNQSLSGCRALRRILSLACALVTFLGVFSLTDDLHAAQLFIAAQTKSKRSPQNLYPFLMTCSQSSA